MSSSLPDTQLRWEVGWLFGSLSWRCLRFLIPSCTMKDHHSGFSMNVTDICLSASASASAAAAAAANNLHHDFQFWEKFSPSQHSCTPSSSSSGSFFFISCWLACWDSSSPISD